MNFGDPLLQQRNYTLPELEREQEALQQKVEHPLRGTTTNFSFCLLCAWCACLASAIASPRICPLQYGYCRG